MARKIDQKSDQSTTTTVKNIKNGVPAQNHNLRAVSGATKLTLPKFFIIPSTKNLFGRRLMWKDDAKY